MVGTDGGDAAAGVRTDLLSRGTPCGHFDTGRCRSCGWLSRSYDAQVRALEDEVRALVGERADLVWEPTVRSRTAHFRNKAKMVVGGSVDAPTLGILDPRGHGVDLRDCPLHETPIVAALPALADAVARARVAPYDVSTRRGELKHLLVTSSPDGELMVRFVLRSEEAVSRLRKHLPALLADVPGARVVSVNLQPEHKAVLEGERELVLTDEASLRMRVNDVDLHLLPQSFFQTNTEVAAALYRQGRSWVDEAAPSSVADLYCGVGGFALHVAGRGRDVVGVEVSAAAVESATRSARELGLDARFLAGDATSALEDGAAPDLVVVNPPRRGIGERLAAWLEASSVRHVVYSSCNARTLARDLEAMPSLRPVRARLLDMFPHTAHHEVVTLLERR
ncbi:MULTISPECIES: 23S rRNA (uracil(747)-C(5))-methyltransferase RlmC [unclassified Nocardioides]|uniref:23S rRNA (uracil(747)-C(5))-methyltransferase RlmC n=1 Tax=unclassified Nocardioides TaxID=2615069 RepID=UPI002406A863|nr:MULTISPECIES: 23S rRNA (uracil(747)-C(5))-methyltransferase RlmC [unclassified Nocardioides]